MNRIMYSLCSALLLIFFLIGCSTTQTEKTSLYPDVVAWNNMIYGISVIEVPLNKLGNEIGKVKRIVKPMPTENGDSNDTPVGSKLYEIKGIDSKDTIAVEKNGKYFEAKKSGPLE